MSSLVPQLKQIKVSPEKLIPDPNNPRLISRDDDKQPPEAALDLLDRTLDRMRTGTGSESHFKIKQLERSIIQNGWQPVDSIFVRKFDDQGHYLVLEGNRRITAIRNIRNNPNVSNDLKTKLDDVDVMEIIDDIPEEQIKEKIMYLLGVRHHGSLVRWSPFAQAYNIYKRYMEVAECTTDTFVWDQNEAEKVADALNIVWQEVSDRLRVYRAMEQIGRHPRVVESESTGGGIRDRYYSVCAEVVLARKPLSEYVQQDPSTFLLSQDSVERMIELCHFDRKVRAEAPINNPQEWRKLAQILGDQDEAKRQTMLARVEHDKEKPSDVWAERAAELQRLHWETWLENVLRAIEGVTFGDDITSNEAKHVIERLVSLLDELDEREKEM